MNCELQLLLSNIGLNCFCIKLSKIILPIILQEKIDYSKTFSPFQMIHPLRLIGLGTSILHASRCLSSERHYQCLKKCIKSYEKKLNALLRRIIDDYEVVRYSKNIGINIEGTLELYYR